MRRRNILSYLCLVLCVFGAFHCPSPVVNKMRLYSMGIAVPSWEFFQFFREKAFFLLSVPPKKADVSKSDFAELESLHRENQQLQRQIENLRQWLLQEDRLEEQMQRIKSIDLSAVEGEKKSFFARRHKQMTHLLTMQTKAAFARVIFREPCCWSSFIWINVGKKTNKLLQEELVAKGSPVVIGNSLVGVVEEVFEARSKVRLVTDANLAISVRALRGERQQEILKEKLGAISFLLQTKSDLFSSKKEQEDFFSTLQKISSKLSSSKDQYLAKGELHGFSQPLWRSRGGILQGIGFNYDFSDDEGSARDLRTGEVLFGKKDRAVPILQEEDLLVTTGLDGVFPPGLEVATVFEISCLREGECSYHIKAKSVISDLNELETVFVLPSL
jgi:rod shape-determining protein MreC